MYQTVINGSNNTRNFNRELDPMELASGHQQQRPEGVPQIQLNGLQSCANSRAGTSSSHQTTSNTATTTTKRHSLAAAGSLNSTTNLVVASPRVLSHHKLKPAVDTSQPAKRLMRKSKHTQGSGPSASASGPTLI